jgi:ubiquitin-protein ligase
MKKQEKEKEKEKKTIVLSKETISRLLKDVKNIIKNPLTDNHIYYQHDDEDILKGYAMCIGPSETPYFGGYYFFELEYPADYPHSPPVVKYCTNGDNIRFNPNLYVSGKVCISLLNTWTGDQWTSCQTISTILLTLCTLLCKDPLLNEPGATKTHSDFLKYTKIIEYKNIEISILKMILKEEGIYPKIFEIFYPIMKEQFIKNKDILKKFIEEKVKENKDPEIIMTSFYNMKVMIDYEKLYTFFMETDLKISNQ